MSFNCPFCGQQIGLPDLKLHLASEAGNFQAASDKKGRVLTIHDLRDWILYDRK